VSFQGVTCFGGALNKSINQGKSRGYLFAALLKKFNAQPTESLDVHGLQMIRSENTPDGQFFAEFIIPQKPSLVHQSDTISSADKSNVGIVNAVSQFSPVTDVNKLLSRKADWMQTLDATSTALSTRYPEKPSNQLNDLERFCNEITSVEEIIRQSFNMLDTQIQNDHLLLSNEKKELSDHYKKDLLTCLDSLKSYAASSMATN